MKENSIFKQAVNEKGGRFTSQRQMIIDAFIESGSLHMTAEEIYLYLKQKGKTIGIATVYRTLKMLEDNGLLTKDYIDNSIPYYELISKSNVHKHHHLICIKCGSIQDAEDDLLDTIEKILMLTKKFKVMDHKVNFYGMCSKCAEGNEVDSR